jgi:hypothetical protein
MPLAAYMPQDTTRYRRHPDSRRFSPDLDPGVYVYVQACDGIVWVLPEGPHLHPRVLGRTRPAVAAGELTVEANGRVVLINNLSGTFRCRPVSLFTAVGGLVAQGAVIDASAITPYEDP